MRLNDFKSLLWSLYPQGLAWARERGAADKVNASLAAELVKTSERIDAIVRESDPRKTAELLTEWESDYGLPDCCSPLSGTLEGRRKTLVQKITFHGDMRPAFYISLAAGMGYDAEITEWRPFICGDSECGGTDMLGGENIRFVWDLRIYGFNREYFTAGVSVCGDPLGSWRNADELECRINKLKPSHTRAFFFYEEAR